MKFLAPCGHPGIPVTVNYVTCTVCDGKNKPPPTEEFRSFNIHFFDTNAPGVVHSIRNVKVTTNEDTLSLETTLLVDCYLHWYRFDLLNKNSEVATPLQTWEYDFLHKRETLVSAGTYTFFLKVPPLE